MQMSFSVHSQNNPVSFLVIRNCFGFGFHGVKLAVSSIFIINSLARTDYYAEITLLTNDKFGGGGGREGFSFYL